MWTETWQRNLAALFVGQTLTAVAYSFLFPFVPLYVQVLGVEDTVEAAQWAGVIAAAAAFTMAAFQPLWGNIADRWGRKPMVVRAMAAGSITIALMGFVTSPEQLLALRIVQGVFMGTVSASTALVAGCTPRDRLGFALGLIQVAMFLGSSIGPLIGGVAADTLGYRISFYIAGSLMLMGTILVIKVVKERFDQPAPEAIQQGIVATSRALLGLAFFPILIGIVFLIQLGGVIVSPVLSLFIAELNGGENAATAAGLVLGATGAVSAVSAIVIGRISDRVGRTVILPICLAGAAITYLPQGFVQQVWQLLVLRMLLGVFLGGLMPTANALVAVIVPQQRRGAAYGLTATASGLANGVGPLMAAAIVTQLGMRAVFVATAGLFALVWGWTSFWLRRNELPKLQPEVEVDGAGGS
ncbi:MAG: MFS transporter [Chloroflexi bacterium]|nr:MFS transporter [Chloroflexota bacterium]